MKKREMKLKNSIIRTVVVLLLILNISGCKTKNYVSEKAAKDLVSAQEIAQKQHERNSDFSTLFIKTEIKYKGDGQSYSVSADIRMKKDEQILVSVKFLGMTMAKALITPTEVKYYEKMNSKYFEGDFSTLSKWLGTDLDFQKVQNLFLGKPIENISQSQYFTTIEDGLHKLVDKNNHPLSKTYFFEASQFLLKKTEISELDANKNLIINYPNYKSTENMILPSQLIINAYSAKDDLNIAIDYKSVTINEDLNFPYSVPSGYDKITLENK